jgi:hypothetical protein
VPEARLIERRDQISVAAWRNVAMLLLHGPPEADDVRRLGDLVADLRRDTGLGVALVHVVRTETVKPPAEDARRVYRDLMRDPLTPLLASAVVIESAAAFASALVSSIITGLELVTRPSFPTRMFSKLPAGAEWLAGELDKRRASFGTAGDLVHEFESVFAAPT